MGLGNFGYDGVNWLPIVVDADGNFGMNVRTWGKDPAVDLTGRDITLDIQAITDDTIQGVFRTLGDAGTTPTNTTGNTVLQLLTDILGSLGAAPYEALSTQATNGGTGTFCSHDTGTDGGRTNVTVIISQSAANCTVNLEGSIDDATYYTLQTITVGAGGGSTVINILNALRYLRLNQTVVGGGTTTGIIATSR
jgi:hypothetical protein